MCEDGRTKRTLSYIADKVVPSRRATSVKKVFLRLRIPRCHIDNYTNGRSLKNSFFAQGDGNEATRELFFCTGLRIVFAESGGTTRMDALRSTFEPSRDDFKLVGFVIRSTEETRDGCGTIP